MHGLLRKLPFDRTVAAALLTLGAVALPSAAWYVAGSREAERKVKIEEKAVYYDGHKTALRLAERLGTRLQILRESESRRPFYHYQNLYHDPKGASEGAAVAVSPLAHGPADPLIEAHFQVDQDGVLTLPTVNDDFPELGLHDSARLQCALQERLDEVAVFCNRALLEAVPAAYDLAVGLEATTGESSVERLDARAWQQHLRANALYADLKYARAGGDDRHGTAADLGLARHAGEEVTVEVGPFRWYTLPYAGGFGLLALRPVETPAGLWTQGFVLDAQQVEQYVADAGYDVSLAPLDVLESESGEGAVVLPISSTPWGVGVDVAAPLAAARAGAAGDRRAFLRVFALGAGGAGLAGLLVVAMVFQAERLARQRSRFAASAAHELRTPLAGLRLYGEMLAEGLGDRSRSREYARRLAAEAERLGRVVTNVLSFTRLEQQSLAVRARTGDLGEAVTDAVGRQRPALEEAGATVELAIPAGLPPALFDRDSVAHIVQNLLDNAEKYTREAADRRIAVRLERVAEGVELTVADHGPGVDPEVRRRLFRPFARGHHPDAPEGLGLGLVLVRELAKAQGARVAYRDSPRGGAVFTVLFAAPSVAEPLALPAVS